MKHFVEMDLNKGYGYGYFVWDYGQVKSGVM